jgi:hypothetical protein
LCDHLVAKLLATRFGVRLTDDLYRSITAANLSDQRHSIHGQHEFPANSRPGQRRRQPKTGPRHSLKDCTFDSCTFYQREVA